MPKAIAMIIEAALCVGALWALCFLSTFLHELGHALIYRIATGDGRGHIRVGSGKTLLKTQRLTVKLLPLDGCFTPPEGNKIDARAKLIAVLAGGPAASLILVAALLPLKLSGATLQSEILASGAIESFVDSAFFINLFILIMTVIPAHYFYGETRGMETDGLQILRAVRGRGKEDHTDEA